MTSLTCTDIEADYIETQCPESVSEQRGNTEHHLGHPFIRPFMHPSILTALLRILPEFSL